MALFTIRVQHIESDNSRHRYCELENKLDRIIHNERLILKAIDELKAGGSNQEIQVMYDKIIKATEQIKKIIP